MIIKIAQVYDVTLTYTYGLMFALDIVWAHSPSGSVKLARFTRSNSSLAIPSAVLTQ